MKTRNDRAALARLVSFVLGVWLIVSAFAWRQSAEQRVNLWVTGGLVVTVALVAYAFVPKVRYLNTALAAWLFLSALALPAATDATIWNEVIVSIVLIAASLVPGGGPVLRERLYSADDATRSRSR